MKFGIATFVTDEGIRPGPLGRALEERGFDSLFVAEHSHIPASRETPYPGRGELPRVYYRTLDPFVLLTAAAAATTNLLVGTGIALLPQRDVFHTAKEVASLDLLSGGRFMFGVGVGWNREEMRDHGVDPATRGPLMNEQLAALKELWTKDQAEFHGTYVSFGPAYSWPKPVQRPHPPIVIGGESEAALDRLLRYGDEWLPRGHTRPERIREVRQWLADNGRGHVPCTVFGPSGPESARPFAEAGVERVALMLPTMPEAKTLAALDRLAQGVQSYR